MRWRCCALDYLKDDGTLSVFEKQNFLVIWDISNCAVSSLVNFDSRESDDHSQSSTEEPLRPARSYLASKNSFGISVVSAPPNSGAS